jgi:hypothetical protein
MAGLGKKLRAAAAIGSLGFFVNAALAALPDFGEERISEDARFAATQVMQTGDHRDHPFAIVDKREAHLYLFDTAGSLVAATPVLIGLTAGDAAAADIARRTPASLAPQDRTTPAGRFESQPGHNDKGEAIVWLDYAASLALHRLRPAPAIERRPERMASATAADHRISLGCIVVPVAFYDAFIAPSLGQRRGVVYVLPETQPVQAIFGTPLEVGLANH